MLEKTKRDREFYFDLDNKTNFTTYSVLCAPLIVSDECIGVIHGNK